MTTSPGETAAAAAAAADLEALRAAVVGCRACSRLVAWREAVGLRPPARFRGERYWSRPVPGFGDPAARILLVGLAPAAHGGNRTGRVFTGDASGDFLWAALHAVGLANQPTGRRADDGLELTGVYVAAAVRCAPPGNRPTPEERARCLPYLAREIALLPELRVIVPLGAVAWAATFAALGRLGIAVPRPRPVFGHGVEVETDRYAVLGSYHVSQQNTFTGRLTGPMFRAILERAKVLAGLATE